MKKLVLLTLFWFTVAVGVAQAQPPRCTPSQDTLNKYKRSGSTPTEQWGGVNGFYPNPSPTFCVGQYGESVIQVILPYDTATGLPSPLPARIRFTSFRLDSITNIPNGLNFQTDQVPDGQGRVTITPANSSTPGLACATIYGTPTTPTAVSDSVELNVFATTSVQNGSAVIKYRVVVANPGAGVVCAPTAIENLLVTGSLSLYPNPTMEMARLSYELKKLADVRIEVLNMAGRTVIARQLNGQLPGNHEVELNTQMLTDGIYLVKFALGNNILTRKLVKASN